MITLPDGPLGKQWQLVLDTVNGFADPATTDAVSAETGHPLVARSLAVFRRA
jgi:hypothetical protein